MNYLATKLNENNFVIYDNRKMLKEYHQEIETFFLLHICLSIYLCMS